jgi:proteic killer suppression protein
MAIFSFSDNATEVFFNTGRIVKGAGWASLKSIVSRKLDMLDFASILSDLKAPPGNRLEPLKGSLLGFHSIRINDQWRIIFRWTPNGPEDVEVTDYH